MDNDNMIQPEQEQELDISAEKLESANNKTTKINDFSNNKSNEDEIERTSKLLRGGDDYFLKVPKKIIEDNQLKEDDYVIVGLKKTKSFIIETDKTTIEEVEKLKKLPQYKDKNSGEIIKELMFKFNKKEDVKTIPSKEIKLVEKGSLE